MDTTRLLVCVALSVPAGFVADRLVGRFASHRPVFVSRSASRVTPRAVAILTCMLGLFILAAWRFTDASWGEMLAYCALFAVFVALGCIDIMEYRLPDAIVLPALAVTVVVVGMVSMIDDAPQGLRYALLGGAAAFAVLLVAHLISPRGMGFGDVKFAALLGVAVGWQANATSDVLVLVLWSLLIGFGIGTIAGVVLLLARRRNRPFPFGPFLAAGAIVAVLLSRSLIPG